MGNTLLQQEDHTQFSQSLLQASQIKNTKDSSIENIFIDDQQIPFGGLIVQGQYCMENYGVSQNLISFEESKNFKIVASIFLPSKYLIVNAYENNEIQLHNPKNLQLTSQNFSFKINFELQQINTFLDQQKVQIISNSSQIKQPKIDFLQQIDNNILVGLSNGVIQQINTDTWTVSHIFNPIIFSNYKDQTEIYENIFLPGISKICYCEKSSLIISVHKKSDINSFGNIFNLPETPIYLYNTNATKNSQITGIVAMILNAEILQNRALLLLLSAQNVLTIYNYLKLIRMVQIDFQPYIFSKQLQQVFYKFTVHEYRVEEQFEDVTRLFTIPEPSKTLQESKIDGDLIFFVSQDGDVLLTKLHYNLANNNNKMYLNPLKTYKNTKKELKQQIYSIKYSSKSDILMIGLKDGDSFIFNKIMLGYYKSL